MQKDRKKEHKRIVKYMRAFNKSVASDAYLGLNRFRIDMFSEQWTRYEDGSGGELFVMFKVSDKLTGNFAIFTADNYSYKHKIAIFSNDFLIRCSYGRPGHFPTLHYAAYDVHEIIPYDGMKEFIYNNHSEEVINKYSWIKGV